MKYAIVGIDGKQFNIKEGDVLELNHQAQPLQFKVLLYNDGKKVLLDPVELTDVKINGVVLGSKKSKKVKVARFKSKSRYDKVRGHRQVKDLIKIERIGDKEEVKVAVKSDKKPKEKAVKTVKKATKPAAVTKTSKKVDARGPLAVQASREKTQIYPRTKTRTPSSASRPPVKEAKK